MPNRSLTFLTVKISPSRNYTIFLIFRRGNGECSVKSGGVVTKEPGVTQKYL